MCLGVKSSSRSVSSKTIRVVTSFISLVQLRMTTISIELLKLLMSNKKYNFLSTFSHVTKIKLLPFVILLILYTESDDTKNFYTSPSFVRPLFIKLTI